MKLAANVTFLFKEYPFLERIQAAADAGFDGVEILFPYDDPAPDILRRLQIAGLPLVLINAPPPNYTGGQRGFAAVPGLEERFRRDFARVLRYAERLTPQHIHLMAGTAEGPEARATFIDNLKWAAAQAPGQSLTIEPLNPGDMPGYFLNDYDLAAEIIDAVGAPNLGLQYDTYHAQTIAGDALAVWRRHAPRVRHVQVGDAPGRCEPGAGGIDFAAFFAAVAASGYDGWISAEYNPTAETEACLGWMRDINGRTT
ncbi:TIM barrel protein [Psychromarinibacter sp. C21-152]|uniref:TIM barrel protein n=1 Tax=Psychromarinibacter sediminicola TaxID=3033385 RepID=A0AAE3TAM3_9RHOB|nr:TIM barrel protein [Psychromarinibacter sediminicola]MDF0603397.1 TIM barrel protein [Psychromarinibacter sediminicola]